MKPRNSKIVEVKSPLLVHSTSAIDCITEMLELKYEGKRSMFDEAQHVALELLGINKAAVRRAPACSRFALLFHPTDIPANDVCFCNSLSRLQSGVN
jgi:hypothetical protein